MADFSKLLAVVHPGGTPIDSANVIALLQLAQQYIMPSLSIYSKSSKKRKLYKVKIIDKKALSTANKNYFLFVHRNFQ